MRRRAIIRMNLGRLLFVCAASVLMVLVSYFFARGIVSRQVSANAREMLTIAEGRIDMMFREYSIMLLGVALSMQNRLGQKQSPEEIQNFMVELTRWFTQNDDAVVDLLDLYADVGGRFFSGRGPRPRDDKPEDRLWYEAALQAGPSKVPVSPPHIDEDGGQSTITLSTVIPRAKGEGVHGVIGVDIDLRRINLYVRSLYEAEGGYGMLLNQELLFMSYIDEWYIGKYIGDISKHHARMVELLQSGAREVSAIELRNYNGDSIVAFMRLMNNGLVVALAIPTSGYYKDVYYMAAILTILGIILMTVVCYLIIQLSIEKIRADDENKSKSDFLARMSHEIRTPMNSILGMAELISLKNISHEVREYISIIRQSGTNLIVIINDILDFSKIESGKLYLEVRKYNLLSLINDVVNVIRVRLVDIKPIDFLVHTDCNIPAHLMGDDVRIRQILLNLLSNAVKYTNEGFISLDVRLGKVTGSSLQLIFRVKDTGIGIKKEDMHKLFTDFSRLDMARNKHVEGSGLGLAIASAFCRMMGGDISVHSEYGSGSTFIATINQSVEDWTPLAAVHQPERLRILLYEERPLHELSVSRALQELGVKEIVRVKSLPEFIASLSEKRYDYAFVSSRYAMDCLSAFGKQEAAAQLVVMLELGELSAFTGVSSVMLPAYSVSLANVLNGISDGGASHPNGMESIFSAPAANVLVVDDISTNLRVAKELISHYDVNVHTSLSGAEAIEMVRKNHYDAVFMDHMMPEMDGLQTTAAIRALGKEDEYFRTLPVIALTANAISGQKEMFLQNGIDDFLAKPIEMQKLDSILRRWIPKEKQLELSKRFDKSLMENVKLQIDGIDIVGGLKNAGGNIAAYVDILYDFCRDAEKRIFNMRSALECGDLSLYTVLAHAVKGAARVIGANDFAAIAERMEKLAINLDTSSVHKETEDFLRCLGSLADSIRAALDKYNKSDATQIKTETKIDAYALKLDVLKSALEKMDISTVNDILIQCMSMPLEETTKHYISEIEQMVLDFEYDKAVEKINSLL